MYVEGWNGNIILTAIWNLLLKRSMPRVDRVLGSFDVVPAIYFYIFFWKILCLPLFEARNYI